jgi:adhesin transport system outer membrane protein|tara:strand:+ start:50 stop:1399 length:1350 start_codon:yes stop_codon:yes gene_type:complete
MTAAKLNIKTFFGCSLLIFSPVVFGDLNTRMFDLSMSSETHAVFMKSLQQSLNLHPESLLQDSLISQQINQAKIIKSELKPKMYFQMNSKSPPLDSETDSFFQSLQQKNTSVLDQTLILEQLITDFGQTKNRVSQQEELVNSERASSLSEKTKLALRMLDACFNTAAYSLLLEVSNSSVVQHQEITDLIKIRVDSGRAPGREMSRSMARLAEAKAKKLLIGSNLAESVANFRSLLPNQTACKKFPLTKFYIELNELNAIDAAQADNNDIRSANFKITALEKQLKSVKQGKYPLITAEIRADKFDVHNSEDYNLIGAVKFNWNLYQGRKRRIQEQNTREEIKAATFQKEVLERNVESLVSSNLAELKQSKLTLAAFTDAYTANVQSREQLKLQFFAANISLLELLQSERDYLEAAEALVLNTKKIRMAEHLHLFYVGALDSYISVQRGEN